MENRTDEKGSSLRWKILRQALLSQPSRPNPDDDQYQMGIKRISRRTTRGFNLIPFHVIDDECDSNNCHGSRDARVCYTLPIRGAPQLFLTHRMDNHAYLSDFEICNRYNIDNTGLVCNWPSEDVLAHYCLSQADIFRSKKVIELGSGYGLAGFVIAAVTEASEVVISDGNPLVVNYTQCNIEANSGAFGDTIVKSMMLHWNQEDISNLADAFDIIVASDCIKVASEAFRRAVHRVNKATPKWGEAELCQKLAIGSIKLEFNSSGGLTPAFLLYVTAMGCAFVFAVRLFMDMTWDS